MSAFEKGAVCRVVSKTAYEGEMAVAVRRSDEDHISWIVPAASHAESMAYADREMRPLIVIDPESAEDAERLDALYQEAIDSTPKYASLAQVMQAALREFADPKPPKPEEPTGLGAVVVDEMDRRWVRWSNVARRPWRLAVEAPLYLAYSDIAAVRVLSEGVRDA